MNFSPAQWMSLFVLDFLSKWVCLFFVGAGIMLTIPAMTSLIPLVFTATFFHFVFLGIGTAVTSFIKTRPRARFALAVLVAEGLLVGLLGFWYVYSLYQNPNPYRCPSFQTICPQITASDLWQGAIMALFLLVINLLPIVVVSAASALARLVGRTPQRV